MTATAARSVLTGALTLVLAACVTPATPATSGASDATPAGSVLPAPAPDAPPDPAPSPATPAVVPGTPALPDPVKPMPLEQARAEFIRDTADKYGVDRAHIASVLAQAQKHDSIITAMSRPAEAKPWRDYRPIFISQARIDGGQAFLARHRDALARVEARYGVPAEIIVSIIGVETSYGRVTGNYRVIDALYTLAFFYPRSGDPTKADRENRREAFFRGELAQLFALGQEADLDITTLKGSYAGAMGWGQFMPSSYREYAVDGNGDGKRDLFNSTDDVFASIANYFVGKGGWVRGGPVTVRATRDPGTPDFEPEGLEPAWSLADLAARGYHPSTPVATGERALPLNLDGVGGKEYWLGFRNFYAITRYNISKHYAMAVYQLAEAIAGRENPLAAAERPAEISDA
ncbi:lytic murein transglycosylase B [Marilutibacter alkalisoli]|uniref:Lytic murein transglycosylase B n=1 Tax=Marilutibacter alkalisoli TaxID=2591633 RepID=A0A514BV04_9GAMM|nr:lytic murein transglycosylase B [Lysobacter alkalisoli]QDH71192.1 lytic murein transglycosylase B [Lysobacter alkalisoli]